MWVYNFWSRVKLSVESKRKSLNKVTLQNNMNHSMLNEFVRNASNLLCNIGKRSENCAVVCRMLLVMNCPNCRKSQHQVFSRVHIQLEMNSNFLCLVFSTQLSEKYQIIEHYVMLLNLVVLLQTVSLPRSELFISISCLLFYDRYW